MRQYNHTISIYSALLVLLLSLAGQRLMAQSQNYVRVYSSRIPVTDASTMASRPVSEVVQATTYTDGLGRPLQTVQRQGSQTSGSSQATDVVSPVVYDALGREVQKYLPYVSTAADGAYKTTPLTEQSSFYNTQLAGQGESNFYSLTDVESSPLNRPLKTYPPGASWAGAGRGTAVQYRNNTAAEDVKIWQVSAAGSYTVTGVYGDGLLTVQRSADEQGSQVVEYKDKDGKVILKKVQVGASPGISYSGWLSTYYIYDDYGNLRLVLQPKAVDQLVGNGWTLNPTLLDELAFRYEYDGRNRMSIKKVPGAAEVYIIYDQWDRPVLTQDGNLRADNKWSFTKYDYLNRPVVTGIYIDATHTGQAAMQAWATTQLATAARYESLNGSAIGYSTTASFPVVSSPELLTITFYDNYNWTSNVFNSAATRETTWDGYLYTAGNTTNYAQGVTQSNKTTGMVTGTIAYILGVDQQLVNTLFYDDRGRVIQARSSNASGGIDVSTTQYNFSGQPLLTILKHERSSTSPVVTVIVTNITYDQLGRVIKTEKKLSNGLVNSGAMSTYTTTAQMQYDALGQLKQKQLGTKPGTGSPLETLDYDYNIRGWLLGMNRDYAKDAAPPSGAGGPYFGFDLGYDKADNHIIGSQYYAHPQYNGNIEGMVWKSKGDGEKRKYDFTYDPLNRLLAADFNQYTGGSFNKIAGVDFSVQMGDGTTAASAYDANGNILGMTQKGLKINTSSPIDQLTYTYTAGTNKLAQVTDAANDMDSKLGDFKYDPATKGSTDYSYDMNGNMITDDNKRITGITYNYLNLPEHIAITNTNPSGAPNGGSIDYVYDAAGNKLKKIVTSSPPGIIDMPTIQTTTYIAGFVYERTDQSGGGPGGGPVFDLTGGLQTQDDVQAQIQGTGTGRGGGVIGEEILQFAPQEEGRIRFKPASSDGTTPDAFVYDYFIKDHLGNTRMVLTDEVKQDKYPVASLEEDKLATEQNYYAIDNHLLVNARDVSGLPDYTNDNGIGNNPSDPTFEAANSATVYQLNSNSAKTGLGITLRVMAGDRIDVFGKSYYFTNNPGTSPTTPNMLVLDLLNGFLGAPNAATTTGIHGPVTAGGINTTTGMAGLTNMFTEQTNQNNLNTTAPRAFINVVFFDDQFKVCGYRVSMVGANSTLKDHYADLQNIQAPKNGFVYIYCSNETPVDVFFDNLQVVHTRSPILEETHYYPFGLTMNGISSKAAGGMINKHKYNGIELNEAFDVNIYDAFYRNLDVQIGRWWQVDPKIEDQEDLSPYNAMANDPVLKSDPLGDAEEDANGGPQAAITLGKDIIKIYRLIRAGDNLVSSLKNVSLEDIAASIAPLSVKQVTQEDIEKLFVKGATLTQKLGTIVSPVPVTVVQTQSKNNTTTKKPTGSYTNGHASGKRYHGKGGKARSQKSGKEKETKNNDPHVSTDWTPAKDNAQAFKDEAQRIKDDGGIENPQNYNKINSPGAKADLPKKE